MVLGPFFARIAIGTYREQFPKLEPSVVHEAWCVQRPGIVIFTEEFPGRPVKAGESFSVAFIVGYFDTIDEMHGLLVKRRKIIGEDESRARFRGIFPPLGLQSSAFAGK